MSSEVLSNEPESMSDATDDAGPEDTTAAQAIATAPGSSYGLTAVDDDHDALPGITHGVKRSHDPATENIVHPVRKKLRRFYQLIDRLVLRQYEIQHEEQTLVSCDTFLEQSEDEILAAANSVLDGTDAQSSRSRLEASRSRLEADRETFRRQFSRVRDLRYENTQYELRLKARSAKLIKLLEQTPLGLHEHKPREADQQRSVIETNTSSAHSSTHSSTPTLLAEYYDSKGDIGVYRERLDELEYTYQEGLAEREMLQDRHDKVTLSDEQYHEAYIREREIISADLEKAEQKAAHLARRCEEAGVEIKPRRRHSSSESVLSAARLDVVNVSSWPSFSLPMLRSQRIRNTPRSPTQRRDSEVMQWLEASLGDQVSIERVEMPDSDRRRSGLISDHSDLGLSPSMPCWEIDPSHPSGADDENRLVEDVQLWPSQPRARSSPGIQYMIPAPSIEEDRDNIDLGRTAVGNESGDEIVEHHEYKWWWPFR